MDPGGREGAVPRAVLARHQAGVLTALLSSKGPGCLGDGIPQLVSLPRAFLQDRSPQTEHLGWGRGVGGCNVQSSAGRGGCP